MVAFLSPDPSEQISPKPRLVRVPVPRPPIAAAVVSPDEGQTFNVIGLSRHEAQLLAILIHRSDQPALGYIGVELGRAVYPAIETESAS